MKLSLVIPCKDPNDKKLKELLKSIEEQDFPKDQMEVLVITEGTSESAKAIGIRKAKGEVIGILASDNELVEKEFLRNQYAGARFGASYPGYYAYKRNDNILNRYFSLIGGNDPLSFYMGKNDKHMITGIRKLWSHKLGLTIGDNGYFIRKDLITKTDLDNYYHIDNANEAIHDAYVTSDWIWHKTGGNIFKFFAKRYRYGLQHAFNKNRRWHLVEFNKPKDIWRLICFILAAITFVQPLLLSLRGYRKIKDVAWFLHPVVCMMTLITYSILVVHLFLRKITLLLSAPLTGRLA